MSFASREIGEDSKSNNENVNNNLAVFKDSTGSWYADCVGDCEKSNSLGKLMAAVMENDMERIPLCDRIAIIDKYFAFHDSKMRRYLLQLMQKFRCKFGTANEREIMAALMDKKVKMHDARWTFKFMIVFRDFMDGDFPRKAMILQKLAQKSCRRPLMMDVYQEIEENMRDAGVKLDPRSKYYEKLEEKQGDEKHQLMIDAGEELSNNEMLAVILYTELLPVSAAFRKSHRKKCISCKWRQTFTHLGSAIKKLHRVFVWGKNIRDEYFGGFQEPELFHGMPLDINQDESQPLRFRTITSLSSSKMTSIQFAVQNKIGCLLCLKNLSKSLSSGELIAAPVHWLSPHGEHEWCLLPTNFLKWKFIGKTPHGVKVYAVFEYQSKSFIPSDDIDEYLMPVEEYFGNIPSSEIQNATKGINEVGALFGVFSKIRCEHCQIKSRLIDFGGRFWAGSASCPCCRKYVLRGAQDAYEQIVCYSCGKYSRKLSWKFPSELDKNRENENFYGVLCQHCKQPHKISVRNHRMTNVRYRAGIRKVLKAKLKNVGQAMFDESLTQSDIKQTIDKVLPELYQENNSRSDFLQIAFKNEMPKVGDFIPVLLKTPFGRKLAAKTIEWVGTQSIPKLLNDIDVLKSFFG